jgi:hypothetical protein
VALKADKKLAPVGLDEHGARILDVLKLAFTEIELSRKCNSPSQVSKNKKHNTNLPAPTPLRLASSSSSSSSPSPTRNNGDPTPDAEREWEQDELDLQSELEQLQRNGSDDLDALDTDADDVHRARQRERDLERAIQDGTRSIAPSTEITLGMFYKGTLDSDSVIAKCCSSPGMIQPEQPEQPEQQQPKQPRHATEWHSVPMCMRLPTHLL